MGGDNNPGQSGMGFQKKYFNVVTRPLVSQNCLHFKALQVLASRLSFSASPTHKGEEPITKPHLYPLMAIITIIGASRQTKGLFTILAHSDSKNRRGKTRVKMGQNSWK